jgi:hypothetical protein
MDAVAISSSIVTRSKKVRSKLSNGGNLLPMTDGRSATTRRFRDLYEGICSDLGGMDVLSEGRPPYNDTRRTAGSQREQVKAEQYKDEAPPFVRELEKLERIKWAGAAKG